MIADRGDRRVLSGTYAKKMTMNSTNKYKNKAAGIMERMRGRICCAGAALQVASDGYPGRDLSSCNSRQEEIERARPELIDYESSTAIVASCPVM